MLCALTVSARIQFRSSINDLLLISIIFRFDNVHLVVILCPENRRRQEHTNKVSEKWSVEGESTGKNKFAEVTCHTKRIQ